MYGDEQYYSFVHLSLQEFLAAFYIRCLDENEQFKAFETIFDQNPLSPSLTFYSGLTNLCSRDVQDVLLKVLSRPTDSLSVKRSVLRNRNPSKDPRRQLLALANCTYECKKGNISDWIRLPEDTVIQEVAKHALGEFERVGTTGRHDIPTNTFTLTFSHMTLLPSDMLSIGKFTRDCCEKIDETSLLNLELSFCSISDSEFKALAIELSKTVDRSKVTLYLDGVCQNNSTALSVKKLIEGQTYIACLIVCGVPWHQQSDSVLFLKRIIEGLSNDSACVSLSFADFSLNVLHIHCLMLLLVATNITCLLLINNDFSNLKGMSLFSRALRYSSIEVLDLSCCQIDDPALLSLGKNLCEPLNSVTFLNIEGNPFTSAGLTEFLKPLAKSRLQFLGVKLLNPQQGKIITMINKLRSASDMCTLKVRQTHAYDFQSYTAQENMRATMHMTSEPELSTRSQHPDFNESTNL